MWKQNKRFLKILFFLTFMVSICQNSANAQRGIDTTTWQIKGTLLNLNYLSMPNLNVEIEYLFGGRKNFSLETGLGLILYSVDELEPALGFKVNQKYNYLYHRKGNISQAVGININYASFRVKTYLLTEESTTNSTYFKYQKMNLHKYRYGGNLEYQIRTHQKVFFELNAGVGFMYYVAKAKSEKVIQNSYRNGVFYLNNEPMINPIIRLKIGMRL